MVHSTLGWKLLILCALIIAIPALIIAAITLSRHEDHTHCEMGGCSQTLTRQTERIEASRGVCSQACSTCARNQLKDAFGESRECQFRCNCCAARERCANMAEMANDALVNCGLDGVGRACEISDVGLQCPFLPTDENCESFGFDVTIDLP